LSSVEDIRRKWGNGDFQTADPAQIEPLPLTTGDKALLAAIGLPVSPKEALTLHLRFESVFIRHQLHAVRLLKDTDIEKRSLDTPATSPPPHLDRLVILGRVADADHDEQRDQAARRPYEALRRLLCLDGASGYVWWLYPEPSTDGRIWCHTINTSLDAYLASLFAYKCFRDGWKDLPADFIEPSRSEAYEVQAAALHREFLAKLEAADPAGFKGGFWEEHAWNEHILLHSV
jgi:hypothetical protein